MRWERSPLMTEPLASVVIPTLNPGPVFKECLSAVAGQELDGGFEIIVIDSCSEDGTPELASSYGRVMQIPRGEFNHGLTRNKAIAEARGAAVALLVQDATPHAGWLEPLVKAALQPGVAGAYSRQVPRPDCPPFIRERLSRWSATGDAPQVKKISGRDELLALSMQERIRRLSFDNVSSCVDKRVWERFPFPRRRFGEDSAWAKEVMLHGYAVVYEPASVVTHSHANSMWYEFKRVYLDHRNWREVAEGNLFNNLFEVAQASWNGVFERWAELDSQGIKGLEKLYWRAYALPYSISQNLAQYLGSRSYKAAMKLRWWSKVDEFMARGV